TANAYGPRPPPTPGGAGGPCAPRSAAGRAAPGGRAAPRRPRGVLAQLGAQRRIDGARRLEDRRDIRREHHDVAALREPSGVLPAHAAGEVVFRAHVVTPPRRSSRAHSLSVPASSRV